MNDMASIRKMRPLPGAPCGNLACAGAGAAAGWAAGASATVTAASLSCELVFLRGKKLVYQRRPGVARAPPRETAMNMRCALPAEVLLCHLTRTSVLRSEE